jgi:dipeptidyl-peptidase-4
VTETAGSSMLRAVSSDAPNARSPGPSRDDFLETYAATHRFRLGRPQSTTFTPDGGAVLFLRSGPRSFVRDLWIYDVATQQERILLTAEQILGGAEEALTPEERARRERLRMADRGIASFTLSPDGEQLLVPLSGRLFLVARTTGAVREVPSAGAAPIDPRFSPDGELLACVRDGDLWVHDLATGSERRLTAREHPHVTWGTAEFVAEEEMGRHRGYWWAPSGRQLAVQRTDNSALETFHILDPLRPDRAPQAAAYPRAGQANADVRLAVIDADTGTSREVAWDRTRWPYLVTVRWDSVLCIVVQDRAQHELAVAVVDPVSGVARVVHVERDDTWINIDQDMPRWISESRGFLWTTEREGAWTLEHRAPDGTLVRRITTPELGYAGLVATDIRGGWLYVRASGEPTETHVWRVPLDPTRGPPERLTQQRGQHSMVFGGKADTVIHTRHTLDGTWDTRVVELRGKVLGEIPSTAEKPPFVPRIELDRVGHVSTLILRPRDFDPARTYPVIVSVYGGPHARMVSAAPYDYLLQQWIADHGFVVVAVDGRGTPGRGRAFERAIRGSFVDVPLADQVAGLEGLCERHPELDRTRVGIYGWSFGGYLSAMAVLLRPDVFHAGVAGAPVTEWLDYDTHYTERYLGLPWEVPQAYVQSSCLTYVERLERPLLLVHGTGDDNVYFSHAMKLSDALFRAGKRHDFLPLANFTHMVPDPLVTRRLYSLIVDHFVRALGSSVA